MGLFLIIAGIFVLQFWFAKPFDEAQDVEDL